jgi:hypothetical protein
MSRWGFIVIVVCGIALFASPLIVKQVEVKKGNIAFVDNPWPIKDTTVLGPAKGWKLPVFSVVQELPSKGSDWTFQVMDDYTRHVHVKFEVVDASKMRSIEEFEKNTALIARQLLPLTQEEEIVKCMDERGLATTKLEIKDTPITNSQRLQSALLVQNIAWSSGSLSFVMPGWNPFDEVPESRLAIPLFVILTIVLLVLAIRQVTLHWSLVAVSCIVYLSSFIGCFVSLEWFVNSITHDYSLWIIPASLVNMLIMFCTTLLFVMSSLPVESDEEESCQI